MLAALGSTPIQAANLGAPKITRPAACPAPTVSSPPSSLPADSVKDGRAHVAADRAEVKLDATASFSGNVELRHGTLHLFADALTYDQASNRLNADGNIYLQKDDGATVLAPRLRYELDTERGEAEGARFSFAQDIARGEAGRLRFEGRDVLELEAVRFTTCPAGRDDWMLRASRLTLDRASETGTATHAVVEFMHVPIFYSPYLSFPLSEARKSGLLGPHLGHTSQSGTVLDVPYYFNLAPNYDDTLTARVLSERGLQLINEFRYLGRRFQGKIDLEYLANDRKTDLDRELAFVQHSQTLSPLWSMTADVRWVSDQRYFVDLASSPALSSLTHLPRLVKFDYGGSVWRFSGRTYTYQTLDTTIPLTEEPYQRLPQLLLNADAPSGANRLHPALESEWANFYRQNSVTGQRLDLLPSLSLPLRTPYLYFTPKAGYRYTSWRLDNAGGADATGVAIDRNPDPERGLPVYSLDSGLTLEREGGAGGHGYVQTLEPRLYYVYIPYENQDGLPVFDAAVPDFSFYNFFRENRFVGADRVGDANQLTVALTSRFLDPGTGTEQVRLSFGQVHYFEDQRVNLPAGTVTQTSSDLIAELYARLGTPWYVRSGLQWDNKQRETRKAGLYLNYRPQPDRIVNFGYRYLDIPSVPRDAQVDVSAQWPLAARWTGLARWNYSLEAERSLYAYAGLEYASCCWALRLTGRHRLLPDGVEDNSLLLEFELSGLAKLGESEENPLRQGRFIFE
jgi:LPS-assembly protein